MLTQAGQSENLTDQSSSQLQHQAGSSMSSTDVCNKALSSLGKNTSATGSPDYTPAVGDVVEFSWCGQLRTAIIYRDVDLYNTELSAIGDDSWYHMPLNFTVVSLAKVGCVDGFSKAMKCREARKLAKAYFAKPFTPQGSYEERQRQWCEHHGIKVGSKVKCARSFGVDENGCDCYASDSDPIKSKFVSGETTAIIESFQSQRVIVDIGNYTIAVPYFVLEIAN